MENLLNYLEQSHSPYHAAFLAAAMLEKAGFQRLKQTDDWRLEKNGKYYVTRGASLVAFVLGEGNSFKIAASHTDSPCFKLKGAEDSESVGTVRLNVEPYGTALRYSFFDRPLKIAGRVVREKEGRITPELWESEFPLVIPSLAFHQNKGVNATGFLPDPQIDLMPFLSAEGKHLSDILGEHISFDLYLTPADKPFLSGANKEYLTSPRLDDLVSVYASVKAITEEGCGIRVCALFGSEEIGSQIHQGAGGDFLKMTLNRIAASRRLVPERALPASLLLSLDNAHALHPNHPEKGDPYNHTVLGGGVVIKWHAGGAYTTDGMTSAIVKRVFERAGVKYQPYFNRAGERSGNTLGTVGLTQVCVPSVDLGVPQLAMHSAAETMLLSDYTELEKAVRAVFQTEIDSDGETVAIE